MEATSVLSNCSPSSLSSSKSQNLSSVRQCCSLILKPRHENLRVRKEGTVVVVMRWGGGSDKGDEGGERPETLFMRELAKRKKLGQDLGIKETDTKTKEEESSSEKKQQPVKDERDTTDQRKRSMALNSEGLDGLVPRGQELVKLGGSFWLSLWPLILASLLAFGAAYLYFGSAFVHTGYRTSPPPYVDPYQLLESEQLPSQVGPNRVPFNTYQAPQY